MTGRLIDSADEINKVLWADAELESVLIDYDSMKMKVMESNGQLKLITCLGYIGYENIGVWDEVVIAEATVHGQHELIDRSVSSITSRLGENASVSGSEYRNLKVWNMLGISFIDGSELKVVAAGFSVEASK